MAGKTQNAQKGQVMIISMLALGGTLLGATTIAGLLMAYQIRQATDLANSSKAFSASDAGVECGLYQFFKTTTVCPGLPARFDNNATTTITCYDAAGVTPSPCDQEANVYLIRAEGKLGNTTRVLEASLGD